MKRTPLLLAPLARCYLRPPVAYRSFSRALHPQHIREARRRASAARAEREREAAERQAVALAVTAAAAEAIGRGSHAAALGSSGEAGRSPKVGQETKPTKRGTFTGGLF